MKLVGAMLVMVGCFAFYGTKIYFNRKPDTKQMAGNKNETFSASPLYKIHLTGTGLIIVGAIIVFFTF